ncbi:MAG: Putative nucleoside permease NupX [Candidatus Celerinatantimonas neptuna]|nr:MAG: Putative nucleoside permease NupX [Candidatus Celerinatantimonas neptuna]
MGLPKRYQLGYLHHLSIQAKYPPNERIHSLDVLAKTTPSQYKIIDYRNFKMHVWMSLVGMAFLLGIAYLLSENRKAIRLRTVGLAFAIQFGIGVLVLFSDAGKTILGDMAQGVEVVINAAQDGMIFLFGGLAGPAAFKSGLGFIFAFRVLPLIIFFSSLITVLYYLGIMQWVIRIIGGFLQKCLGTSRTESLSATANIFMGQTEAPLVVRPFIAKMTRSELFAVMVGGLASVAGSTLAGYAGLGVKLEYLIAASFMAAPGGLLMAKMIVPETQKHNDDIEGTLAQEEKHVNVIDAAASGASSGLSLALNVGAMLLAFIGLVALLNMIVGGVGGWFGITHLTIQEILGWIFSPVAYLIGVPWHEAVVAGSFIGEKIVLNEFVAYIDLVPYIHGDKLIGATKMIMSEHTQAIITFALCGFANISSVAILLGGLGGMAPSRRHEMAELGVKAIIAGTLSNLMSATIAGLFIH